jgi:hypothetical protein
VGVIEWIGSFNLGERFVQLPKHVDPQCPNDIVSASDQVVKGHDAHIGFKGKAARGERVQSEFLDESTGGVEHS